jgi:hypothetical protein
MNAKFDQLINEANVCNIFFRAHNEAGIGLEAMQDWKSYHGMAWNEETEEDEDIWLDGVCVSDALGERNFGGSFAVAEEIVVLRGQRIEDIYDGVVIYPTEVVCRFTVAEYDAFCEYVDGA